LLLQLRNHTSLPFSVSQWLQHTAGTICRQGQSYCCRDRCFQSHVQQTWFQGTYSGLGLCSMLLSYSFILFTSMHWYHCFIWRLTKAQLYYSHHFVSAVLLQHILALKGPSTGSTTDTLP
jgi:hypothetical protein